MPDSNYVEAQMLIRKPVSQVFNSIVDPQITTQFWFTKSSAKLESGKTVLWEWEMYGAAAQVDVKQIVPNQRIAFEWGAAKRKVVFSFDAVSKNQTYVTVRETGYIETGDELLAAIRDSTGGFTTVLDGMKAFLEHGVRLNLIGDKFAKRK